MVEIKINASQSQNTSQKQRYLVTAETILKYLISDDEKLDTLIMCKPETIELITTDFNLYEALGSVKPYDSARWNKLTKFLEVVDVVSHKETAKKEKVILKEERVEEIRKNALSKS